MSESGGWCLFILLWLGGPIGAIVATIRHWDDHRMLAWGAVAAIVAQIASYVAAALMVRDRMPGPDAIWENIGLVAGVAGLALGAYALVG